MFVLISLLIGCGTSESGFAEDYAKQLCSYDEHCHKSEFVENFDGDVDECVEEILDKVDDDVECDFDGEKARSCLKKMRDARSDCDDEDRIDDDCYEAFDCAGVLPSEVSEDNFFELYIDLFCEMDCGSSYAAQQCDNAQGYTSDYFDCPDFNLETALECLDPSKWSCADYGYDSGDGGFPQPPRACNEACYGSYSSYDYSTDY